MCHLFKILNHFMPLLLVGCYTAVEWRGKRQFYPLGSITSNLAISLLYHYTYICYVPYRHKSFCIRASSSFHLIFSLKALASRVVYLYSTSAETASFSSWWSWVIKQIEKESKQGLSSLIILVAWEIWKQRNNRDRTTKAFTGVFAKRLVQ